MRSCNIPEEKEEEIEQPYVKTQKKRLWVPFSTYFFGGGKGGRRPVASVEFFGFENISFLTASKARARSNYPGFKMRNFEVCFWWEFIIIELRQPCFWVILVSQKWAFFLCNMSCCYQICIAISIFTLLEMVCPNICLKITAQEYKNSTSSLCVSLIITNPDYLTCWG